MIEDYLKALRSDEAKQFGLLDLSPLDIAPDSDAQRFLDLLQNRELAGFDQFLDEPEVEELVGKYENGKLLGRYLVGLHLGAKNNHREILDPSVLDLIGRGVSDE